MTDLSQDKGSCEGSTKLPAIAPTGTAPMSNSVLMKRKVMTGLTPRVSSDVSLVRYIEL